MSVRTRKTLILQVQPNKKAQISQRTLPDQSLHCLHESFQGPRLSITESRMVLFQ